MIRELEEEMENNRAKGSSERLSDCRPKEKTRGIVVIAKKTGLREKDKRSLVGENAPIMGTQQTGFWTLTS